MVATTDFAVNLSIAQSHLNDAGAMRSIRIRAADAHRQDVLAKAVEVAVIPQLLAQRREPGAAAVSKAHVDQLVQIVLREESAAAVAYVNAIHRRGVMPEAICLDLLASAACVLGAMWEDDLCDFIEVSIGLGKLKVAMREMRDARLMPAGAPTGPSILLVPLPGEHHSFGLSMVHDFFVRAGWDTWTGPVASSAELRAMVTAQRVDVLGFSLASDQFLGAAEAEIAAVRQHSRNPALVVMVGGPSFVANPALAARIGADGTALNGLQAVTEARRLVSARHITAQTAV